MHFFSRETALRETGLQDTKLHIHPGLVFVLRSRGNRYIKWRMTCVFIEPGLDVFTIERSIIMTKYFLVSYQ